MTPAPVTDDLDTAGFFAAAAQGRLAVCRCARCDAVLHAPVAYCRSCGAFEVTWTDVTPAGRVYSYSVVTHQVHPDFPTPYTLLLIELDDLPQVRLVTHVAGLVDVHIGRAVVADFPAAGDVPALPIWRLA